MCFRNTIFLECVILWMLLYYCDYVISYDILYKGNSNHKDISDTVTSDINHNSWQLLKQYSEFPEKHVIITRDGYKLTVYRMRKQGPPVLLSHGIGDSSDSWLVLGPKDGLAYLLAEAGFDIWLFNARGNQYSKGNVRNITKSQYWDFSYEEMGTQDLPATIDYILRSTSQTKLSYVGFSQGSTIFFVMCSMRPEYNGKIKQAILLAPVAKIAKIKYPFIELVSRNLDLLTIFAKNKEVFPNSPFLKKFHSFVCQHGVPQMFLCQLEYYIQYGILLENINNERLPVIATHIPAGTSSKVFLHFIQGYARKRFQRYDYGTQQNLQQYSSLTPPKYDVSLITAPVVLMVSESDWFTAEEDVQLLRTRMPNIKKDIVLKKSLNFSHLEFVYGSRVKKIVNEPVLKILIDEAHNNIMQFV